MAVIESLRARFGKSIGAAPWARGGASIGWAGRKRIPKGVLFGAGVWGLRRSPKKMRRPAAGAAIFQNSSSVRDSRSVYDNVQVASLPLPIFAIFGLLMAGPC